MSSPGGSGPFAATPGGPNQTLPETPPSSRGHQNNAKGNAERLALKPFSPGLGRGRPREPGSAGSEGRCLPGSRLRCAPAHPPLPKPGAPASPPDLFLFLGTRVSFLPEGL